MKNRILKIKKNGAKDAEHFGFMDPDPQKYAGSAKIQYADPRGKISTKKCKKKFIRKTQI